MSIRLRIVTQNFSLSTSHKLDCLVGLAFNLSFAKQTPCVHCIEWQSKWKKDAQINKQTQTQTHTHTLIGKETARSIARAVWLTVTWKMSIAARIIDERASCWHKIRFYNNAKWLHIAAECECVCAEERRSASESESETQWYEIGSICNKNLSKHFTSATTLLDVTLKLVFTSAHSSI